MKLFQHVVVVTCGAFIGCGEVAKPTATPPKSESAMTVTPPPKPSAPAETGDEKTGAKTPDGRELTQSDLAKVNKDNFLKINIGMPQVDVQLILGKPIISSKNEYFYYDVWIGNERREIKVHYRNSPAGPVVERKEQDNL